MWEIITCIISEIFNRFPSVLFIAIAPPLHPVEPGSVLSLLFVKDLLHNILRVIFIFFFFIIFVITLLLLLFAFYNYLLYPFVLILFGGFPEKEENKFDMKMSGWQNYLALPLKLASLFSLCLVTLASSTSSGSGVSSPLSSSSPFFSRRERLRPDFSFLSRTSIADESATFVKKIWSRRVSLTLTSSLPAGLLQNSSASKLWFVPTASTFAAVVPAVMERWQYMNICKKQFNGKPFAPTANSTATLS